MTAQIPDSFYYKGNEYSICAVSNVSDFFDPHRLFPDNLNFTLISYSTACWRGYVATFGLDDSSRLILKDLDICLSYSGDGDVRFQSAPIINGRLPLPPSGDFDFPLTYKDFDAQLDYSGNITICKGFHRDMYVHMGFQDAYAYDDVIKLYFSSGQLVKDIDLSAKAKRMRDGAKRNKMNDASGDGLLGWITRRFDLSNDPLGDSEENDGSAKE